MRFFYPSHSRVLYGRSDLNLPPFPRTGFIKKGVIFNKKSFAKSFPFRGCDSPCNNSKHKLSSDCRPCLLHEFVPCRAQSGRSALPQHTKCFLRESTMPQHLGRGWVLVGSHNISASAWGSVNLLKGSRRNRVNSFELGVLLTDVSLRKYDAVIPWERRCFSTGMSIESLRLDQKAGQRPWMVHNLMH